MREASECAGTPETPVILREEMPAGPGARWSGSDPVSRVAYGGSLARVLAELEQERSERSLERRSYIAACDRFTAERARLLEEREQLRFERETLVRELRKTALEKRDLLGQRDTLLIERSKLAAERVRVTADAAGNGRRRRRIWRPVDPARAPERARWWSAGSWMAGFLVLTSLALAGVSHVLGR